MSKYPMPTSPESIIWNHIRFHAATGTELQTLINNANVWQDRDRPIERAIKRLSSLGWDVSEKKTKGEVTYTLNK